MMRTIHTAKPKRIGISRHIPGRRSHRPLAFAAGLALGVLVSGLSVAPVQGQTISREYPLKAAFLYNFANYVEWPSAAFQSSTSPFIVGVLGPNPFGSMLDELAKKTVRGR